MYQPEFWTGVSAVVVAIVTAMGTYLAARLHLRSKGITPQDAAQVATRAGFVNQVNHTLEEAIRIAAECRGAAEEAKREVHKLVRINETLRIENAKLRKENVKLRKVEAECKKMKSKVDELKSKVAAYRQTVRSLQSAMKSFHPSYMAPGGSDAK